MGKLCWFPAVKHSKWESTVGELRHEAVINLVERNRIHTSIVIERRRFRSKVCEKSFRIVAEGNTTGDSFCQWSFENTVALFMTARAFKAANRGNRSSLNPMDDVRVC